MNQYATRKIIIDVLTILAYLLLAEIVSKSFYFWVVVFVIIRGFHCGMRASRETDNNKLKYYRGFIQFAKIVYIINHIIYGVGVLMLFG